MAPPGSSACGSWPANVLRAMPGGPWRWS